MKFMAFLLSVLSLLQYPFYANNNLNLKGATRLQKLSKYLSIPTAYIVFSEYAIAAICLSRFLFWLSAKFTSNKIRGIPSMPNDSASTWLGSLIGYSPGFKLPLVPNTLLNNHQLMMNMFENKGPLVQCSTLGKHLLLVADPVTAYDVLQNCNSRSSDVSNDWLGSRQLFEKQYHLSGHVIATQVQKLLLTLVGAVDGDPVELDSLFCELSLNIVLNFAFGVAGLEDIGYASPQEKSQASQDIRTVFNTKLNSATYSTVFNAAINIMTALPDFFFTLLTPVLYFFPNFAAIARSYRRMSEIEIRLWRAVLVQDAKDEGIPPGSFRASLVEYSRTHSEKQVLAQIRSILMKGHEKTAHTLSFFFMCLSLFGEGQGLSAARAAASAQHRRMFDDSVDSTNSLAEEVSTYIRPNTSLTPIVEACLKESMRLFPVSASGTVRQIDRKEGYVARTSNQAPNDTNGDNDGVVTIPDKTLVLIHTYSLHRGAVWANPTDFYPQRWLSNAALSKSSNDEKLEIDVDAVAQFVSDRAYSGCGFRPEELQFLPFGAGDRNCAGMHFALQEIRITIMALLLEGFSFEFSKADAYTPTTIAVCDGLLRPRHGMTCTVRRVADVF